MAMSFRYIQFDWLHSLCGSGVARPDGGPQGQIF
jgi:hypothetical protein